MQEIEGLYGTNEPAKLADVDSLIEKYGENKLLSMVRKQYNAAPATPPAASEQAAPEPTLPDGWAKHESKDYAGRFFYLHVATNTSQWTRPDDPQPATEEEQDAGSDSDLPPPPPLDEDDG